MFIDPLKALIQFFLEKLLSKTLITVVPIAITFPPFFKVLFRTLSKYFQTTFPKTNGANMEDYVSYFDDKVKNILEVVHLM